MGIVNQHKDVLALHNNRDISSQCHEWEQQHRNAAAIKSGDTKCMNYIGGANGRGYDGLSTLSKSTPG